jgi:hypothetical protein
MVPEAWALGYRTEGGAGDGEHHFSGTEADWDALSDEMVNTGVRCMQALHRFRPTFLTAAHGGPPYTTMRDEPRHECSEHCEKLLVSVRL